MAEVKITATKAQLCDALLAFINQRSGLDFHNYSDRESLLDDYRPMIRHGKHARELLKAVVWRDGITAEDLIDASDRAFSGRLQFKENEKGVYVDYCPGQYFPTEYRNAACAVLARALWSYWAPDHETVDDIRKTARKEFGRAIQQAWFY